MRRIGVLGAWLSATAVLIGFVLPWARIEVREPALMKLQGMGRIAVTIRRGAKTVTGNLPALSYIPRQVSGAQIPRMANHEQAQLAMATLELLTNTQQHLRMKSYAVYLVPGLACLFAILLTLLGHRAPAAGIALTCGAVAVTGFWKFLTTDTTTLFVAVTIGEGLWLSLWGYVGLAVSATALAWHARTRLK